MEKSGVKIKIEKKSQGFLPWFFTVIIFLLFSSLAVYLAVYEVHFGNKILPGVFIGELDFGGKTKDQALALVQAKIDQFSDQGIIFKFNEHHFTLRRIASASDDMSMAYELWLYSPEKIVAELYARGRQGSWLKQKQRQFLLLWQKQKIVIETEINEEKILETLRAQFFAWENPGHDAILEFHSGRPDLKPEKTGQIFDYRAALVQLSERTNNFDLSPININLIADLPSITSAAASTVLPLAETVAADSPRTVYFEIPEYYNGRKNFSASNWIIDRYLLEKWLAVKKDASGRLRLGFNKLSVNDYLVEHVVPVVNTPANDARFVMADGKAIEWQSSNDGFLLDIENTVAHLENEFIDNASKKASLVLIPDKSEITNENVNNLGIQEIFGFGESNFSGSPQNRRHNIAAGSSALNGILIAPEEEFSLLKALGPINAETGYKPELVIRDGKTVPEYGGGLCQIGTTMFRLAINSGLPVTERRNHSYRVSYYEPAGTDATIYDPWPDLKFINDSGHHLLLQTNILKDVLFFEFWGTGDGRQVATTTPVIYNVVKPAPAKLIESEELQPGEKKCLEKPHYGADAYFERTVVWPEYLGRESLQETWKSHYVPWQEVCLVGKTTAATTTAELPIGQ